LLGEDRKPEHLKDFHPQGMSLKSISLWIRSERNHFCPHSIGKKMKS